MHATNHFDAATRIYSLHSSQVSVCLFHLNQIYYALFARTTKLQTLNVICFRQTKTHYCLLYEPANQKKQVDVVLLECYSQNYFEAWNCNSCFSCSKNSSNQFEILSSSNLISERPSFMIISLSKFLLLPLLSL